MMTFSMVLGALALFAVGIFFTAAWISDTPYIDEERAVLQRQDLDQRLAPVGQIMLAGSEEALQEATAGSAVVASVELASLSGEQVYQTSCSSCHAAGVLEAPIMGDQQAWATRYQQGFDTLVEHAVNGYNAMPAKGGNMALTDDNIRDSIIYILQQSDVDVAEAAQQDAAPAPQQDAAAAATDSASDANTATAGANDDPPAAVVQTAAAAPQPAAAAGLIPAGVDLAQGEETYGVACFVCHDQAVAGAPKLDDRAAWAPRLQQDWDTLVDHVVNGFNGMPAKGGRVDLSDEQVINALAYMVDRAQ